LTDATEIAPLQYPIRCQENTSAAINNLTQLKALETHFFTKDR